MTHAHHNQTIHTSEKKVKKQYMRSEEKNSNDNQYKSHDISNKYEEKRNGDFNNLSQKNIIRVQEIILTGKLIKSLKLLKG